MGEPCSSKHPAGEWTDTAFGFCRHRCPLGWEFSGGFCHHPCNAYGGFETTCGPLYCSVDTNACVTKSLQIAVAFGDMLSNLAPGGKVLKAKHVAEAVKKARKGGWAAKKLAFKAVIRQHAKNLVKRMRQVARAKTEEILLGGAELVLEAKIAQETTDAALKALALDLAEAADPTGIFGVVRSFEAPSCKGRAIDWMPAHRRLTGLSANSSADDTSDPDDASDVESAENVEGAVGNDEPDDADNTNTSDPEDIDTTISTEEANDNDDADDNADAGDSEDDDAASNGEDSVIIDESGGADITEAGESEAGDVTNDADDDDASPQNVDEVTNIKEDPVDAVDNSTSSASSSTNGTGSARRLLIV